MTHQRTDSDDLDEFLRRYEHATNTHDFDQVAPLLSTDAVYWFSDGTHIGLQSIRAAFQKAWATIVDEHYSINDVRWLAVGADTAACTYRYTWSGLIGGQPRHGAGRCTNVIARRAGTWRIVHEHLSPEPNDQ